ncbi:hypothetical protein B0H10DRAFT_2438470 [Mycena sp. CBHHK59/15]|nr:hypothetical protein B0H10DRAFT_2438470 [Mycena sp. CBHHK59/15]
MTSAVSPAHALPYSQRLRLIRSVRKLGDLLTETSLLVESASPTPSAHPCSTSMSSTPHSPISPAASAPRTFLSLRFPKSLTADRAALATPLSATFSISLNSPITPPVDTAALQERRMAKVAQTLGENVPPELVFPPPTRKGRKRASTVSVPEYGSEQRGAAAPVPVVSGRRRRTGRTMKHAASSTSLRAQQALETDLEPFSYPSMVPVPTIANESARKVPGDEGVDEESHEPSAMEVRAGGMRRKELGWSGEWSGDVQSMEDVLRGLRCLRLK